LEKVFTSAKEMPEGKNKCQRHFTIVKLMSEGKDQRGGYFVTLVNFT